VDIIASKRFRRVFGIVFVDGSFNPALSFRRQTDRQMAAEPI
jgi:hypothetical protein